MSKVNTLPLVYEDNSTSIQMSSSSILLIPDHYVLWSCIALGGVLVGCNVLMSMLSHRSVAGIQSLGAGLVRQFVSLGDLICGLAILTVLVYTYTTDTPDEATRKNDHSSIQNVAITTAGSSRHANDPTITCYIPNTPNLIGGLSHMPLILLCIAIVRHVHIIMVYSSHQHLETSTHIRRILFPLVPPLIFYLTANALAIFSPNAIAYLNSALPFVPLCTTGRSMPSVYYMGATVPSVAILGIVLLYLMLDFFGILRSKPPVARKCVQRLNVNASEENANRTTPCALSTKDGGDVNFEQKVVNNNQLMGAKDINVILTANRSHCTKGEDKRILMVADDNILDGGSTVKLLSIAPHCHNENGTVSYRSTLSPMPCRSGSTRVQLLVSLNAIILVFPLIVAMTAFLFTETGSNPMHFMILLLRWTILSVFNLLVFVYYIALPPLYPLDV